MSDDKQALGWCVLEMLGHIRVGGFITEEEHFGSKIGRIDVYGPDGQMVTQYFGGNSVFRITPTTEAIAKAIGAQSQAPIARWELRALEEANPGESPPDDESFAQAEARRFAREMREELDEDDDAPPF